MPNHKVNSDHTDLHSLAKNSFISIAGQVLPFLVGLIVLPLLINRLQMERFGLLSMVWTVIGYFTISDLGLGRAIVKLVAERITPEAEREVPDLFWTSFILMSFFSGLAAFVLYFIAELLSYKIFQVPVSLKEEGVRSFQLLALAIIPVTLTASLRGLFEARHNFKTVNLIQVFVGTLNYLGPLCVLYFTVSIETVVSVLCFIRWLSLIIHFVLVYNSYPHLIFPLRFSMKLVPRLFIFGGWVTLSNILISVKSTLDRFILGIFQPLTVLPYLTTPQEVLNRLLLIPGNVVRVLFPAFAVRQTQSFEDSNRLYNGSLKVIYFITFGMSWVCIYFAHPLLKIWINADFARESALVLQVLSLGILFNSLAWLPFTYLQSLERADITAKMHIVELVLFGVMLLFLVPKYGLMGVAYSRVLIDMTDLILLFYSLLTLQPGVRPYFFKTLKQLSVGFFLLMPGFISFSPVWNFVLAIFTLGMFFSYYYWVILNFYERYELGHFIQRIFSEKKEIEVLVESSHQPLVTVMIPCYNQAQVLDKAIESALGQTYSNIEVIVSDDQSTDQTQTICQKYLNNPKFRYHRTEKNLGRVGNYNLLIYELAKGEWLLNVDGDDYLYDSHYIAKAVRQAVSHDNVSLVFGRQKYKNTITGVERSQPRPPVPNIMNGEWLLQHYYEIPEGISHISALYKRSIAIERGVQKENIITSDTESLLRLLPGHKVVFINHFAGVWHGHEDNDSGKVDFNKRWSGLRMALAPAELFAQMNLLSVEQNKEWSKKLLKRLIKENVYFFLDRGHRAMALEFIRKSKEEFGLFQVVGILFSFKYWVRYYSPQLTQKLKAIYGK